MALFDLIWLKIKKIWSSRIILKQIAKLEIDKEPN